MSKTISAVVAAVVFAGGVMVMAAPTTVTGILVDRACYTKDKANTTNDHKGMSATCAQDCAKKGQPVALVTDKGEVYTVTGDLAADMNKALVPHMSHTMALTGEVTGTAGKMSIAATSLKMISK
jgi:hypothetical protein